MTNMTYCRFQNTLKDLSDCSDYMDPSDNPDYDSITVEDDFDDVMLSADETAARRELVDLCGRIHARFD